MARSMDISIFKISYLLRIVIYITEFESLGDGKQ